MPLRRTGSKRTSEQSVALVQMQIAAQARNQRWHDFLCAKRDELQARLRQQGYSQGPREGSLLAGNGLGSDVAEPSASSESEVQERWGAPEQPAALQPANAQAPDGVMPGVVDVQAAEALGWWEDRSRGQL
jgi:hypothetical protein